MMQTSPIAASWLRHAIANGDHDEAEQAMGSTDCPNGCEVEPDGTCPHGYVSAGKSAGMI